MHQQSTGFSTFSEIFNSGQRFVDLRLILTNNLDLICHLASGIWQVVIRKWHEAANDFSSNSMCLSEHWADWQLSLSNLERFFGFIFLIRFAHFHGFTILHVDRIFVWIVYWSNCATNSALFVAISERILCGCLDSEQHNNQRCHLISATILVIFKKNSLDFR